MRDSPITVSDISAKAEIDTMPRVLRNYLISFLIIALFGIAVMLIDHWADEKQDQAKTRDTQRQIAEPASGIPDRSGTGMPK